jgi:hypothetical protein
MQLFMWIERKVCNSLARRKEARRSRNIAVWQLLYMVPLVLHKSTRSPRWLLCFFVPSMHVITGKWKPVIWRGANFEHGHALGQSNAVNVVAQADRRRSMCMFSSESNKCPTRHHVKPRSLYNAGCRWFEHSKFIVASTGECACHVCYWYGAFSK